MFSLVILDLGSSSDKNLRFRLCLVKKKVGQCLILFVLITLSIKLTYRKAFVNEYQAVGRQHERAASRMLCLLPDMLRMGASIARKVSNGRQMADLVTGSVRDLLWTISSMSKALWHGSHPLLTLETKVLENQKWPQLLDCSWHTAGSLAEIAWELLCVKRRGCSLHQTAKV